MGANPTQAQGVILFLVSFAFIAAAICEGGSVLLFVAGLLVMIGAVMRFRKCKPWEHEEE